MYCSHRALSWAAACHSPMFYHCKISLQENPSSYLRQFFYRPVKTKYPTLARDYRQTYLHEKKPGNDAARAPRV